MFAPINLSFKRDSQFPCLDDCLIAKIELKSSFIIRAVHCQNMILGNYQATFCFGCYWLIAFINTLAFTDNIVSRRSLAAVKDYSSKAFILIIHTSQLLHSLPNLIASRSQ